MADTDPPNPSQQPPGVDRQALAAAHERRVADREFVDILTSPAGPHGPPLQVRWEHDVSSLARPGTGGRQPSIARGFEIEATREVRARLGEPTDHTFRGALLHVWEIPGGEDGIIAARLSGQDVKKHETVFGQIHGLLDICERRALKPRFLIASMRNSGHRTYATRLDFSFIRDRVHAGQCSWVAYYKVDRIARSVLAANLFYQFLQDTHTGLFLEELGREVDWDNESDMLMLNTLGSIGQFEGARIKARTHDPFKRRWVLTGRGWPAANASASNATPASGSSSTPCSGRTSSSPTWSWPTAARTAGLAWRLALRPRHRYGRWPRMRLGMTRHGCGVALRRALIVSANVGA